MTKMAIAARKKGMVEIRMFERSGEVCVLIGMEVDFK